MGYVRMVSSCRFDFDACKLLHYITKQTLTIETFFWSSHESTWACTCIYSHILFPHKVTINSQRECWAMVALPRRTFTTPHHLMLPLEYFPFSNFPTPLPNLLYFPLRRCLYRFGRLVLNPFPSYLYLYYSSLLFRLLPP